MTTIRQVSQVQALRRSAVRLAWGLGKRPRHRAAVPDLTAADLLTVRAMLAAGAGPAQAIAESGAPGLQPVRTALSAGSSLPDLAAGLDDGSDVPRRAKWPSDAMDPVPPAASALVRALAVAEVVGASPGPGIDGVLQGVAAAARLQAMISLRSAQAVMSARFLIGLPLVAAAGLSILDNSVRLFLTSPLGAVVILVALGLIGVAALWIRRLIGSVTAAGGQVDPLASHPRGGPAAVTMVAGVLGIVATVVLGPAIGVTAAATLWLIGGPLRRRLGTEPGVALPEAAGTSPDVPSQGNVTTDRPGSLPTAQALELLAVALSAGLGLVEAVRITATLAPEGARPAFRRVAVGLGAGLRPVDAFPDQLAEIAELIDMSHRWGAPIAQSLQMLAADLRDRAAIAAEEAAERLTVRLVFPTTMLLVPAFGLLVVTPMMASILSDVRLGL